MEIKNLLASLVILLTYVGLTLGHLPFFRMNRAGIILVGVTILSLMGIINLKEAWQSIDAQTLVFLFGIMILNAHLGYAGFFGFSMQALLRYARSPLALLCIISFSSGLLSAFFLNDTMALMLTPLVYGVVKALKLNPNPYLLALMFSVNTGSLMTPTGNPQNILIASISGLSFVTFIKNLWIVSLFGLLLQILILTFIYPEVRSLKPLPPLEMTFRVHKGLLRKGIMVTSGLFLAFLAGLPMAESAFIACGLLLFTRRLRSERYFSKIDWELLILFAGLFILTFTTQKLGLHKPLLVFTQSSYGLLFLTVILSLLISNVPAVLILSPYVTTSKDWLLLAGGSTLAGNLTLLASVANLIVAELLEKGGHTLSFWEHLKIGLPLTLLNLLFLYLWLYLLP